MTDQIRSIVSDSRIVKKGDLFVAIRGLTVDSHKFIPDVIKKGAVAIVGEIEPKKEWPNSISYFKVKDSREALGLLASAWYDNPSRKLKVIGVTGTDGKTTTSNLIWHILNQSGKYAGLISTINARIGNKILDTGFHVTNPDPLELQKYLSMMVDVGCEYAVVEVTSHGLDQRRVAGVKFDTGVLTNITHEHLDYHRTYDAYLKAKSRLFENVRVAVINKDDKSFDQISKLVAKNAKKIVYGKDTLIADLKLAVEKRFSEDYNRLNATAAIKVAQEIGVSNEEIKKAIESFKGLEGRMEEIKNDMGIRIIVDFAHTPNALENVLKALSSQKGEGRLIAIFGSAGERDIEKRKLMPHISVKIADFSVFTAEDPRSEKIEDILEVMVKAAEEAGAKEGQDFLRIPERGQAIFEAVTKIARKGDIVVICGKGHEKSMAYNGVEYSWSDQDAVRLALNGKIKTIVRN